MVCMLKRYVSIACLEGGSKCCTVAFRHSSQCRQLVKIWMLPSAILSWQATPFHRHAWCQAMGSQLIISIGMCSDKRLPGQGREAEVVVFSTVRCNSKSSIGFVSDERRLNVAITRPRRCLPFPSPLSACLLLHACPTEACSCMELSLRGPLNIVPVMSSDKTIFAIVTGHEAAGTFNEVTQAHSMSGLSYSRT